MCQFTNTTFEELQGIVIGQSPGPNSLQPRGATITLSVSKGPRLSTVPDVTGLDQDSAQATLEDAGFKVSVKEVESTDKDPGTVLHHPSPS